MPSKRRQKPNRTARAQRDGVDSIESSANEAASTAGNRQDGAAPPPQPAPARSDPAPPPFPEPEEDVTATMGKLGQQQVMQQVAAGAACRPGPQDPLWQRYCEHMLQLSSSASTTGAKLQSKLIAQRTAMVAALRTRGVTELSMPFSHPDDYGCPVPRVGELINGNSEYSTSSPRFLVTALELAYFAWVASAKSAAKSAQSGVWQGATFLGYVASHPAVRRLPDGSPVAEVMLCDGEMGAVLLRTDLPPDWSEEVRPADQCNGYTIGQRPRFCCALVVAAKIDVHPQALCIAVHASPVSHLSSACAACIGICAIAFTPGCMSGPFCIRAVCNQLELHVDLNWAEFSLLKELGPDARQHHLVVVLVQQRADKSQSDRQLDEARELGRLEECRSGGSGCNVAGIPSCAPEGTLQPHCTL